MGKTLVEMAAEIVQSQCRTNSMSSDEVSNSLEKTYKTLTRLSEGVEIKEKEPTEKYQEKVERAAVPEPSVAKTQPEKKQRKKKDTGEVKEEVKGEVKGARIPSPEKSIQRDKIICLECGKSFKILSSKHLKTHGLSPREYRQKHGFSLRQALCSKTLSEKRKKAGEERGAPENLLKSIAKRKKAGKAEN